MAKRRVHIYNDPVLRKKARPVNQISGTIRKLIEDMFETMYTNHGIGLAAPQVGISKRVFVVDTGEIGEKAAFINPKIVSSSKNDVESYEEGCLSLPDIQVDVVRPKHVTVEYLDPEGKPCRLEAEGMLARCIQHEYDHLEGTLIVDRAHTPKEKQRLIELVEELEEAYA